MGKGRIRTGSVFLLMGVVLILGASVWLGTGCLIRRYTGLPCPGCGLTRAYFAVFRLELAAAFRYHPMFWSVPVFLVFLLFDGRVLKNEKLNNWILYGITAAFIGCYVIRLMGFLGGFLTI